MIVWLQYFSWQLDLHLFHFFSTKIGTTIFERISFVLNLVFFQLSCFEHVDLELFHPRISNDIDNYVADIDDLQISGKYLKP